MAKAIIKSTGEVIEISHRIDSSRYGIRYVIAGTSKSVAESEIMIFDDSGVIAFIEKWYPDYYHSDIIAWIDDLHCALGNECDDEKLARIGEAWGTDPKGWLIELINLESAAYRRALERYYSMMYPKINI
ncbi:hypothetical protein [Muribaculum intestinale]|uniref:Uncharacterized protein n=1 Tax=Muribaculum intestinale TaxID=1796646 RepID=A0A4S2FXI2_9BACT|nr:hypothetical protein [Muribaculum intestinale]MYM12388.1 hypothetical protein [Muribaculum intestinale]TGY74177.1 hypothetical protein E5333_07060 [Muribaculum intestinale]